MEDVRMENIEKSGITNHNVGTDPDHNTWTTPNGIQLGGQSPNHGGGNLDSNGYQSLTPAQERVSEGLMTPVESPNQADPEATKKNKERVITGYVLITLSVLFTVSGLSFAQLLNKSIPHSQLNGFRFLSQLLITAPALIYSRRCDVRVPRAIIPYVIAASLLWTSDSYMQFGAAYYLPLGVTSGIYVSLVLVLVTIIGWIRKRSIVLPELVAVALCVVGVAILTQQTSLFGAKEEIPTSDYVSPCINNHSDTWISGEASAKRDRKLGYILSVLAAVAGALICEIMNTKIPQSELYNYLFWVSIFGSTISFIIMGSMEKPFFPNNSLCLTFFIAHILSAGANGLCVMGSLQLINPVFCMLIYNIQIPVLFILESVGVPGLIMGRMDALEIVGALLVIAGNFLAPIWTIARENNWSCIDLCRKRTHQRLK